jgi:hypothetical protein
MDASLMNQADGCKPVMTGCDAMALLDLLEQA